MHIAGIIRHVNYRNYCCDTSWISLMELLTTFESSDDIILYLEGTDGSTRYIDLMKLYAEQSVLANNVTDWSSLEDYLARLTLTVLDNYRTVTLVPYRMWTKVDGVPTQVDTPFATEIAAQLKIYSVENNFGIDVAYGTHDPTMTLNYHRLAWSCTDLVFINTQLTPALNFKNTIPIVNGIVCYPVVAEATGYLYAYLGANIAKHVDDINKNLLLVDFSELGDIDIYPLYQCEPVKLTGLTETDTLSDEIISVDDINKFMGTIEVYSSPYIELEFLLPEGATSGYPILCISGRLFDPSSYKVKLITVGDRYKVSFKVSRQLLENILAANLQKYETVLHNTSMVKMRLDIALGNLYQNPDKYEGTTADEINASNYWDHTIAYVIILHSEEPFVHNFIEPTQILYPDKLMFPTTAGGLLINRKTLEVVDYVKVPYESGNLVTFPPQAHLRSISRSNLCDLTTPNIAIKTHNAAYTDKYNKFDLEYDELRELKNYALLDLTVARLPEEETEASDSNSGSTSTGSEASNSTSESSTSVSYSPLINRVSAQAINVTGIETIYCGNYVLVDSTAAGLARQWQLHDSIYGTGSEAYVGYDATINRWYIGTGSEYLYLSSLAYNGSSPWHKTLTWYAA